MLKQLSDVLHNVKARDKDDEAAVVVLDTRVKPVIRIINGSLDEDENSPNSIVLNGRIDPSTLRFLKVDSSYQRPLSERPEIFEAMKAGIVVPNIDIGVRGQDFTTEGNNILIHSPAYVIDGWQRVGNALRLLELIPDQPLRIFASIHFGTNDIWERHRFTELNKNVKKISPNLHLRNMRDSNEAVLTLYGLSNNTRDFALYGKVCWSQSMKRGELMQAYLVSRTAVRLHAHIHPANYASAADKIAATLATVTRKTTLAVFRKNITTFFDVIEECWGIRSIELRASAPQIKSSFLLQLARMFSTHLDFWGDDGRTFFVSANMRHKLAKFPLADPYVKNLVGGGGGPAGNILYDLIVNHVNSGKRIGHLRSRFASR